MIKGKSPIQETAMIFERAEWLVEKRRRAEERYDMEYAPTYDETLGATIEPAHRQMTMEFLRLIKDDAEVLDAACGTGKYWPMLLERGLKLYGSDNSREMLARATEKHPDIETAHVRLQELRYMRPSLFDGVTCIDAMENVPPEDWPLVLMGFQRVLRPGGLLYMTVELMDVEELRAAFKEARRAELPVVIGEYARDDTYHYYPSEGRVCEWLDRARFKLLLHGSGSGYDHYVCRARQLSPL
jgi:ubiquinone/menaquinone biosynthesis C-methylase UbiE